MWSEKLTKMTLCRQQEAVKSALKQELYINSQVIIHLCTCIYNEHLSML